MKEGGSVRHQSAPPDCRDPEFAVGSEVREVCRFLMNSLAVEFGPEGNLAPGGWYLHLKPLSREDYSLTGLSVMRAESHCR